jgi:hypothetical protein
LKSWYKAPILTGRGRPRQITGEFSKIPADANWKDVLPNVCPAADHRDAEVFVSIDRPSLSA